MLDAMLLTAPVGFTWRIEVPADKTRAAATAG